MEGERIASIGIFNHTNARMERTLTACGSVFRHYNAEHGASRLQIGIVVRIDVHGRPAF